MSNIGLTRYTSSRETKPLRSGPAVALKAVSLVGSLTLLSVVGSGCKIMPTLCAQETKWVGAPDHASDARVYQEEALRILADASRHSALAVQYAEKATSGSDASLWRDLAEYQLRLASAELNAASLMVAIAMTHWHLAYGPQPPQQTERAP